MLNYNEITLWKEVNVEAGTSPPHCGTMDVNLELRGVDCNVGKTDTAVRTILCETGWENAESLDAFASQASSASAINDYECNQRAADARGYFRVRENLFLVVTNQQSPPFYSQTLHTA